MLLTKNQRRKKTRPRRKNENRQKLPREKTVVKQRIKHQLLLIRWLLIPGQGIVDPIGMREFAYEMLLELKHRSSQKDFALEHMQDLLDSALDAGDIDLARKIMIPEFSAAYRRSCEVVPSAVVAKSLRAATGFAAHDKQIWRQTKGIETIPHIYRIRVGIHHRLMIQWNKEKGLKVLDLIPRAQLETWIRRHAA